MVDRKKPSWRTLGLIGLLGVAVLLLQTYLSLWTDSRLWLSGWVLFFYGVIAIWILFNREALEGMKNQDKRATPPTRESYDEPLE